MTELPITVAVESPTSAAAIERMHQRTFGPGRFARTAFRLREHTPPDLSLSFTAYVSTMMVGSVRLTPIWIGEAPALLLGPLTVEPPFRSVGIGARLMRVSMEAAREQGHKLVLLRQLLGESEPEDIEIHQPSLEDLYRYYMERAGDVRAQEGRP